MHKGYKGFHMTVKMSCFHAKAHLVFHWHLIYNKYYMLVIYIKFVVNKKVLTGKPTLMASKSKMSMIVHVLYLGMLHPLDILV